MTDSTTDDFLASIGGTADEVDALTHPAPRTSVDDVRAGKADGEEKRSHVTEQMDIDSALDDFDEPHPDQVEGHSKGQPEPSYPEYDVHAESEGDQWAVDGFEEMEQPFEDEIPTVNHILDDEESIDDWTNSAEIEEQDSSELDPDFNADTFGEQDDSSPNDLGPIDQETTDQFGGGATPPPSDEEIERFRRKKNMILGITAIVGVLFIVIIVTAVVLSSPPPSSRESSASAKKSTESTQSTKSVVEVPGTPARTSQPLDLEFDSRPSDYETTAGLPLENAGTHMIGAADPSAPPVPAPSDEIKKLKEEDAAIKDSLSLVLSAYQEQEQKLSDLEQRDQKYRDDISSLRRTVQQLRAADASLKQAVKVPEVTRAKIVDNRIRLGSFNILDIDQSGQITAISPSGRRITLVQGERVRMGSAVESVEKVYPDLLLATIGKRWFIDVLRTESSREEIAMRRAAKSKPQVAIKAKNELPKQEQTGSAKKDAQYKSAGSGDRWLTMAQQYELGAVVGDKAIIRNCTTQNESVYRLGDDVPGGHGRIRKITPQEVITDKSAFLFDVCS